MTKPKNAKARSTRASVAAAALITVFAAGALNAPASASERDATAAEASKVTTTLREQGYRSISDVDVIGDTFVADAISPSGRDVDVVLDRATLKILRVNPS